MLNRLVNAWFRRLHDPPCFQIYGKARWETAWRVIDVFASHRHDADSRWPLMRGACVTWSDHVIVLGWDLAEVVILEQRQNPVSREAPLGVAGGRLGDASRRTADHGRSFPYASEVLAHEIGHTAQALRLGIFYLPVVGSLTLYREGPHWWNHFENQASEQGQFGGIVNGSVCDELMGTLILR
jgi:hypothetical protein